MKRSIWIMPVVFALFLGAYCAESEDSTDDLLLGFLAGGGGDACAGVNAAVSLPFGTPQSVPDQTSTKVNFIQVDHDPRGMFNVETDIFTIPVSGTYLISATTHWFSATSGRMQTALAITASGVETVYTMETGDFANGEATVLTGSGLFELSAGDTFFVQGRQSTGGAHNLIISRASVDCVD